MAQNDVKPFHLSEESGTESGIEVTHGQVRTNQGQVLFLVDEGHNSGHIIDHDDGHNHGHTVGQERNFNIQYAEIDHQQQQSNQQQLEQQQQMQEMRQKGEMIQQVRNQRKQFPKNRRKANSNNIQRNNQFDLNQIQINNQIITVNGQQQQQQVTNPTNIKQIKRSKKNHRNDETGGPGSSRSGRNNRKQQFPKVHIIEQATVDEQQLQSSCEIQQAMQPVEEQMQITHQHQFNQSELKVVHINQLDSSIDSVIDQSRLIDEDDNQTDQHLSVQHLQATADGTVVQATGVGVVAAHSHSQSGQSTVVVPADQKDLLVMEPDMVQFTNTIEDQDTIEHELFKVV